MLAATGLPDPLHRRETDALQPIGADWDMSWVGRVKGKYRAVFDSPEISEGAAIFRAALWKQEYHEVFGAPPAELSPVLVIRHRAIALAMDDAYWSTFEIGKHEKLKDPSTGKWAKANPIRTAPAGTPADEREYSLEGFLAAGGVVLACNMAFGMVVGRYAERAGGNDYAAARAVALQHLIPGIILQPSGIFAALHAQEAAGCRYILAS